MTRGGRASRLPDSARVRLGSRPEHSRHPRRARRPPGPRSWPRCAARSRFLGEALSHTDAGGARAALAHRGARGAQPALRRAVAGAGAGWSRRCWRGRSAQPGGSASPRRARPGRRSGPEAPEAHRREPQGRPAAGVPGQGPDPRHGRRCVRFGDRGLACTTPSPVPLLCPNMAGLPDSMADLQQLFQLGQQMQGRLAATPDRARRPHHRDLGRRRHGAGHGRRPGHGAGGRRSIPPSSPGTTRSSWRTWCSAAVAEAQRRAADLLQAEMRKVPPLPFARR